MTDIEKQAYDIKSFCAAFSVSRSYAYQEIAAARLKPFKLGRKTLISREAAHMWLREREHGHISSSPDLVEPNRNQTSTLHWHWLT